MNFWIGLALLAGGYVAAIFTWDWLHTKIVGVGNKAAQLRQQAKDLEASVKARL